MAGTPLYNIVVKPKDGTKMKRIATIWQNEDGMLSFSYSTEETEFTTHIGKGLKMHAEGEAYINVYDQQKERQRPGKPTGKPQQKPTKTVEDDFGDFG